MNQPRICRPKSWMTCKGQFFGRCEKPHAIISCRASRSQKECSFRQVRPSCKLLHLNIFETITINNHSYGIAPIWLAGENIYLGKSALHVDNSVTLSLMNNGGDAENRNPRKLASKCRTVLVVEFHPSTASRNCPWEPVIPIRLSPSHTKYLPKI